MAAEDASKLFVAGLPDGMTEESLRELFANTGSIVEELTMPRDRATGRPRGFAFVRLGSPEQAESARGTLDGTLIDGRSISVRPFSAEPPARGERRPGGGGGGRGPDASDRTLYVGNLPYDANEQEVRDLMKQFGCKDPQRVHLPTDPTGRGRGFGFVTFDAAEGANEAIVLLREAAVRGRRCVINIAHPKGERPSRPGGFEGRGGGGGGGRDWGPAEAGGMPSIGDRRGGGGGGPPGPGGPPGVGADGKRWGEVDKGNGGRRRRKFEGGGGKPKRKGGGGGGSWDDDDWE